MESALRGGGLLDPGGKRLTCLVRRADGRLDQRDFLYLWEDREDAKEFARKLNQTHSARRWSVFEIDVIPLHEILDPRDLELPPLPKVVDIKTELFVSSTGADALRVWVILDDDTTDEDQSWLKVRPIEDAIQHAIQSALPLYGLEITPFVWFRTKSEFADERVHAT